MNISIRFSPIAAYSWFNELKMLLLKYSIQMFWTKDFINCWKHFFAVGSSALG